LHRPVRSPHRRVALALCVGWSMAGCGSATAVSPAPTSAPASPDAAAPSALRGSIRDSSPPAVASSPSLSSTASAVVAPNRSVGQSLHETLVPTVLPIPLSRTAAVALGNDVLVFGGMTPTGTSSDRIYSIPWDASRVALIGHLPAPLHDL